MAEVKINRRPVNLSDYQPPDNAFAHRSLRDLLEAREFYHEFLVRHPNVVATAVGRYLIRHNDSWPNDKTKRHGKGARTLSNSEVRPYSWPCILVFVSEWQPAASFADNPSEMIPPTLFMPDGRSVPVCVVEAPKESATEIAPQDIPFPTNNLGPGRPVIAKVQGRDYVATVCCLVSDGHKVYALTNRHVTGEAGEIVYARRGSSDEPIGESSGKQLLRMPLTTLYPSLPGKNTYVDVDVGLIDLDDLDGWTAKVPRIGVTGSMADFSDSSLSLSLVGCHVVGFGAASGEMRGAIQGLFYRYKTTGGFDYVADLMIGPRTDTGPANAKDRPVFQTLPGDSGTMWMLEPLTQNGTRRSKPDSQDYLPLAVQWGRNMLRSAESAWPQGYGLATLLSRVCALLDVEPVRDWNLDVADTWGALGHFSIAARARVALSGDHAALGTLITNNAEIISRSDADLTSGQFAGMGSASFVPMADVPDFFWKPRVAKQGHARASEGPNHFADMDQKDAAGRTLLDISSDPANIDAAVWDAFYETLLDRLKQERITPNHRGLLPFRVWQIFDHMVEFVKGGDGERFVCAAGVLSHYLGDACQPLHVSYLHDGDPARAYTHTYTSGKKAGQTELRPLGNGVHSAYEDGMIFEHRKEVLSGLMHTRKIKAAELIPSGRQAAELTVAMMRETVQLVPPMAIVDAFISVGHGGKAAANALWGQFGDDTMTIMRGGTRLLALLWESAWVAGDGDNTVRKTDTLSQVRAMEIVSDRDFLPSVTIDKIGALLS
ncbi:hypothetical protein ABIB57_000909 [Devosia sp. UYZn731]|uniref:hypothetical protein n=1 Tax=Devosia sp. UYZn731 TaxID=3156345 RepID=UPI003392D501